MDVQSHTETDTPHRRLRRGRINVDQHTVLLAGTPYYVAALPPPAREFLELLGLKTALLMRPDAPGAYAELKAGVLPEQRPPSAPRRAKWREAIANALAFTRATEEAPKGTRRGAIETAAATLLGEMMGHVATLDPDALKALRQHPVVQEHYHRLFGIREDNRQLSLLALAGIAPELPFPMAEGAPAHEAEATAA